MYVIYPADELLRIYENRNRDPSQLLTGDHRNQSIDQVTRVLAENQRNNEQQLTGRHSKKGKSKKEKRRERGGGLTIRRKRRSNDATKGQGSNEVSKGTRRDILTRTMLNSRAAAGEDAANPLRELTQPGLNEPLKQHNAAALKLVQTVSEFAQELGTVMETHSTNVRRLVDEFRTRSADTRVDTGGMRRVWESMLRQVQADAEAHLDLAAVLQQQLSRPTLEASFHRKLQSKKVFAHREAYEQVVAETEKKLQRARADYKRAYAALLTIDDGSEQELKRAYFEAHNAYVLQLRATNAITERYQSYCLPNLLNEIAEVYEELCGLACKCVGGVSEAAAERSGEQTKRYQAVVKEAQVIAPLNDLQILARSLGASVTPSKKPNKRLFVAPAPPERVPTERINQIPSLRDELAPTGANSLTMMENLRREHDSLTQEITRLQDALDALIRMQRKSAESNLYTKVAELQEDISMKRFELGEAQLYLAAVQAQKELFGAGEAGQPDGVSSRKMSNGSTGSTKHKWLKAFKSLKTSSPTTPPTADKKSLESEGGHCWREYTYRKITPCDACGQVLRGHSRQGVRCRSCKANAHTDCINLVQPAMCPKKGGGIPLLRRQKTQAQVDETPATEHRRGSGGSMSGTRPFGQPLVLMTRETPPISSPKTPEPSHRGANRKR
ncbi:Proto-oncogene vav [Anthophora retusa]